ncbi:MAG: hypothetical protein SchgKO_13930 [Schleiferiaceae bacterium]
MTKVHFFTFSGRSQKWDAFVLMGRSSRELKDIPGAKFMKMLGVGGGKGFAIYPNWGMYTVLSHWESEEDATSFEENHPFFSELKQKCDKHLKIIADPLYGHGSWNGDQPFEYSQEKWEGQLMVLTRASISRIKWPIFWFFVPTVSRRVFKRKGLLMARGVGELPLIEQATLSVWENAESMASYAYKQKAHSKMIQMTRSIKWYREELFVRFAVREVHGDFATFSIPS